MNHIAIIEDNARFSEMLKQEIAKYNPDWMVYCFQKEPENLYFDAYFLDVELQGNVKGFEIAESIKKIDPEVPIMFVSSHEELVYVGYRYQALRFIRKRHLLEELEEALDALSKVLESQQDNFEVWNHNKHKVRIYFKQVKYIYSEGNYLFFVDKDNEEFKWRGSIRQFSEHYKNRFVMASAGVLINPIFIRKICKKESYVYLSGNQKIKVSQRNLIVIMKAYIERGITL